MTRVHLENSSYGSSNSGNYCCYYYCYYYCMTLLLTCVSPVQVSDQLHNTTTSVIVNVLDDNDNAPVFTESGYEVNLYSAAFFA